MPGTWGVGDEPAEPAVHIMKGSSGDRDPQGAFCGAGAYGVSGMFRGSTHAL